MLITLHSDCPSVDEQIIAQAATSLGRLFLHLCCWCFLVPNRARTLFATLGLPKTVFRHPSKNYQKTKDPRFLDALLHHGPVGFPLTVYIVYYRLAR